MLMLLPGMDSASAAFGFAAAMVLLLLLALWMDARWGEPPAGVHPVVGMGKYLAVCGRFSVRFAPAPAFVLGALAWWFGAVALAAILWFVQAAVFAQLAWLLAGAAGRAAIVTLAWLGPIFVLLAWLLKAMLSWRMLRDEAGAVEVALQCSLEAGQHRLAWLVSRDTSALSEIDVREGAIESLAENLNDSVVAPVFWFVLFGLPGAAVYRFANTADAMWGYRGARDGVNWEWAGKWAAWADDALSWLPARITALLLALVCGGIRLKTVRREARKTPSPNSGWPMAAMALALGVRLHKPGVYVLNGTGRPVEEVDTFLAQKYASKAVLAACLCALAAITLIAVLQL